ncbi:cation diffusion facilitator family transporter [Anabaena sp. CS-542/02]|uniref:cation diffusion facilitator family transporter n=1 Tax=Anabaena sp. CS-542/02 TaxID=3021719 RepID=UPI0023307DFE|nr:cation diffusion facilitator family transporter [Anabaena sp. CS-542/02]MDB9447273.1 cation diffusion facilitator family transporter [Anabaena sp. CS-542/02]
MTKDNRPEIQKVLIITLLLNMLVVGLKGFLGYATGSLSLLADALHSTTDAASNILGLVANRYSAPEPDREHPYGHQKFESVGALGIAVLLLIACFEILQGIVERITQGSEPVEISPVELWLLLVVLGINIFVAFYERRVGQRLGSAILIADATHTMSDVWVTISVIGGLIGVWRGYQWLDVVLAFPVALLVLGSAWSVLKTNLPWLVDQMAIAPETIEAIATAVPGVINCHDIASRGILGRQVFIEIHLIIDAVDVETAHKISEEVERRLERHFSPTRILIHIEPPVYQPEQIS